MNCSCVDTSKKCLDICEKTIDVAQDLIAKCGGTREQECVQEVGEMISYAEKCLQACHDVIAHNRHYLESAKEKEAMHVAEEAIIAGEKTIASIEQVLGICKVGKSACIDACNALIDACNNCAETCRKCVAMGI